MPLHAKFQAYQADISILVRSQMRPAIIDMAAETREDMHNWPLLLLLRLRCSVSRKMSSSQITCIFGNVKHHLYSGNILSSTLSRMHFRHGAMAAAASAFVNVE